MTPRHHPDDPACRYYTGPRTATILTAITRLIFGDLCNECRTLGKNARP